MLIKVCMARELIQALHLSAQAMTEKTEIVPKLLDPCLTLCKLILEASILQAQLLDHHGEVDDGWSPSSSVAPGLSW